MEQLEAFIRDCERTCVLSSSEIAKRLEISPSMYCQMKTCKKRFSGHMIDELIEIFGLTEKEAKELYYLTFITYKCIKLNSDSNMYDYLLTKLKNDM